MSMDKLKSSVTQAALDTADALRAVAQRLETAASMADFSRLAEVSIPLNVWSTDQIRGAALAIVRIGDGLGRSGT